MKKKEEKEKNQKPGLKPNHENQPNPLPSFSRSRPTFPFPVAGPALSPHSGQQAAAAAQALAPPLTASTHASDAPSHAHASPALFLVSLTARPHLSASSPSFPSSSRQRAPHRPRHLLRCLWTPARPCRPTSQPQRTPPCLLEATRRALGSRRAVSTIRFLRDLLRRNHHSRFLRTRTPRITAGL